MFARSQVTYFCRIAILWGQVFFNLPRHRSTVRTKDELKNFLGRHYVRRMITVVCDSSYVAYSDSTIMHVVFRSLRQLQLLNIIF
jgi:hypothetical protein